MNSPGRASKMSTGKFGSSFSKVWIQRRIDFDENRIEVVSTQQFWLVDAKGDVLGGPFSSLEEANEALRDYLDNLDLGLGLS